MEGEFEDRRTHLRPVAPPLEGLSQPGAGGQLSRFREITADDRLHADQLVSGPHAELELPALRPPGLAETEVIADELLDESRLAQPIGPGHHERHLTRLVDAGLRQARERD